MKFYRNDGSEYEPKEDIRSKVLALVKGPSGVGKSTRIRYLLEWFRSKEEPIELLIDNPVKDNGKKVNFGLLFESENLLFIGKMCPHKYIPGLSSWYSLDYTHRTVKDMNQASAIIGYCLQYWSVVAEGNPGLGSFRYRAKYVLETLGAARYFARFVLYRGDVADYIKRCVDRTGKAPKSDSGFEGSHAFARQMEMDLAEATPECDIAATDFEQPPEVLGADLLRFLGKDDRDYMEFCKANNFHRPKV